MGDLGSTIIANMFNSLRNGDVLWFENTMPIPMLNYIRGTTLANIISRNSNVNVSGNVFML